WEVLRVDLKPRNVRFGIPSVHLGGVLLLLFLARHLDFVRAVHDVVVGEDVTVFGDDHARAEAALLERARRAAPAIVAERLAEKPPEKRIVKKRSDLGYLTFHGLGREDVD